MPRTRFTNAQKTVVTAGDLVQASHINNPQEAIKKGIQAHRHTITWSGYNPENVDTDALDSGNSTQLLGEDEIKDGTINLHDGTINSNDVAGKINGQYVIVTTPATANTEFAVAHSLKDKNGNARIPQGYLVVRRSANGVVYDGTTSWTTSNIYLKCSAASVNITLLIF